VLREQKLPGEQAWQRAAARAGSIFGVAASPLLSANNVSRLAGDVKKKASDSRGACRLYNQRLRERLVGLKLPLDSDRMKTAGATLALIERMSDIESDSLVDALAAAEVATSETAMGECVAKAAELEGNLNTAGWEIFDAVGRLTDERQAESQQVLADVLQALASDEHVVQLAPALKGAQARAVRLLTKPQTEPRTPVEPHKTPSSPPTAPLASSSGRKIVAQDSQSDLAISDAQALLSRLNEQLRPRQSIRITINWTIEEGGAES
jgi:hypothetical protein